MIARAHLQGMPFRVGLGTIIFALLFFTWKSFTYVPHGLLTELANGITGPHTTSVARRANATFIILCRNSDTEGIIRSVREIEDRFNRNFGYPYVFLDEEPFTKEFKRRLSVISTSPMEFGLIPHEFWYQPSWIDEEKATAARKQMVADNIIYGGSLPYRNMCRFNSGFFFRHPLVQKYRYYWRVEPGVHFHCNVDSDPFLFLQDNNKTYGFTIAMYEFEATIRTLWQTVREFTQLHPQYIHTDNTLAFLSNDNGLHYNLCHFWSNFEIADMDFWRSDAYMSFFNFLDEKGGFYYERWGDAPVHSIAASLFLPRDAIHFFQEIGYEHAPYTHCPLDTERWSKGQCSCDQQHSFDYDGYSCLAQWEKVTTR
ncbi:glycosyltransferase family 15 protein [Scleroderma citrinum Foug A]|uniref:Glycosyltransferase family 15 protein n=1 Tax=Scleroderma citrinum Foug A TaxID=1036808 RepID=A0A0C3DHR1_9AGAM|nr:glycosyltransferase family 15 protein [Scleroderma citrinum Foug A]